MGRSPLYRALRELLTAAASSDSQDPAGQVQEQRELRLSRRAFLEAGGAAFGAAMLPSGAWAQALPKTDSSEPVAIIGAGVAGLTAAYRLKQAGVSSVLYEAGPRLGGRIFTQDRFNDQGMFCELGGELIDTGHRGILTLCAELGVAVEDLNPTAGPLPRNLYRYGGVTYDEKDLLAASQPFIRAVRNARAEVFGGGPDGELSYRNLYNGARLERMTLKAWLSGLTEVEPWVRSAIETAYVTEFGLDAEEQTALNVLGLVGTTDENGSFRIFGQSDEAKRCRGGNSRLILALAAKLGLASGESEAYRRRWELVRLDRASQGLKLTFKTPGGIREITSRRAICTLPFTCLRKVEGLDRLGLGAAKLASIKTAGYGTNSKLMLGFQSRVWREKGRKTPPSMGGLFWDLPSQSYWDTSRLQKGAKGILTNYTGGARGYASNPDMKPDLLAELETLHSGIAKLHDGASASMNWGRTPFALGSYVCPRPGDYAKHIGSAGEPELGGQLLFAGEHAINELSGYMNGGVESGNAAARAVLARR